jgi:hypothetical protein
MDPSALASFAAILTATGPYGILVVAGMALWRINEAKDRQYKELSQQIINMASAQTEAVSKVEAALVALKNAIDDLRHAHW